MRQSGLRSRSGRGGEEKNPNHWPHQSIEIKSEDDPDWWVCSHFSDGHPDAYQVLSDICLYRVLVSTPTLMSCCPCAQLSTTPWRRTGELRYSSAHPLTSALDGGECSTSGSGRLTPRERAPGTHLIGGWVGPRAVLDEVVKKKIPGPRRELNPRTPIVQPVAQRYTDWAITASTNPFIYLFTPGL
jgi:hypothetical protein